VRVSSAPPVIVAATPRRKPVYAECGLNAARQVNGRVALFSMEMSTEQAVQRSFSAEIQINSPKKLRLELRRIAVGQVVEATGP